MHRMTLRLRLAPGVLAAAVSAALFGGILPATPSHAVSAPRSTYIVELAAEPLAAYDGGIRAYAATSPAATGRPLDRASFDARRYAAYLDASQGRALELARAASAPVMYHYRAAFPGFAARLTPDEVARLRRAPGVRAVTPDGVSHPMAVDDGGGDGGDEDDAEPDERLGRDGAAYLGLPDGLWSDLGGPDEAGEGVIVGVLDTGIYPEHPSFADEPDGGAYLGPAYSPPNVWRGACQSGEEFAVTACNNKLIGARFFVEGFGPENIHEEEFLSPRDADGHGSHTAATAAGNYGVDPRIAGNDLGIPYISGIAPRAYVAAYKICWTGRAETGREVDDSCTTSDTVAAIDAAVTDGVDVINYSVGSSTPAVFGPTERAFLFAVDAGVFVAAAAGNDGPEPGSVGSPTSVPWVTSVAASTLARSFETTVRVTPPDDSEADPVRTRGASMTLGLPSTPLIDSVAVVAAGAAVADAELCLPGTLDPAAVQGKAVLCKRGNNPRVEKGEVVRDAGGVGMVLYNATADEELAADGHVVPAAHVTLADGEAIKALLAGGPGAELTLGGGEESAAPGDVMAAFSSRGPQTAVPDLPKPDLSAPGVNIVAADTPNPAGEEPPDGELFQSISGTSMSTPHVAGAAALLTQVDPSRSPAAIKSALMTTADTTMVKEDGKTPADPFDRGAGRIDPNRAATPGLVLDADLDDYARYLEGQDPRIVPGDLPPLAAADLNLPAVSFGSFTGVATTSRTFTSVEDDRTSWTVAVEGVPGLQAAAAPEAFELEPGQSQTVELRFTLAGAPTDQYTFGAVVLTGASGERTVHLPVSIRPVKIAPARLTTVTTDQAAGSSPLTARVGYSGDLSAMGWGLAPPRVLPGETVGFGKDAPPFEPGPGVDVHDVQVPPGTQLVAAETANVDGGNPDTDLDLFLFHDDEGNGFDEEDRIAASADADSDETIVLPLPAPGAYRFGIVGFKTQDPVSTYDFTTWVVADPSPDDPATPSTAPGLAVRGDPLPVAPGDTVTLALEWSNMSADGVYLGIVTFFDSAAPDPHSPLTHSIVRIAKGAAAVSSGAPATPLRRPPGRASPGPPGG